MQTEKGATLAPHWFLILAVAETLHTLFTKQELAVRAWLRRPSVFGLAGYAQSYPGSNAVIAKLYGATGLVGRGYLEPADGGVVGK
jgi:hypothetical protein